MCIMAASIPILRALSKGGLRGPVHLGYETGYPTAMAETGMQTNRSIQSRAAGLPLPERPTQPAPPPQLPPTRPRRAARQNPDTLNSLDETLTAGSAEAVGNKSDDDFSDEENIKMTNYRNRAQSPVDFTRGREV